MCFDEQELLAILAELVRELHHRKKLFASAGPPNIDQYNAETGADLRRLILPVTRWQRCWIEPG